MQAVRLEIPEVVLLEAKIFGDARGFFYESFNQKAFNQATGLDIEFVQDNHSRSAKAYCAVSITSFLRMRRETRTRRARCGIRCCRGYSAVIADLR